MSRSYTPIQRLYDFKDSVTRVMITDYSIIASSVDGHLRVYDIRKSLMNEISIGHPVTSFDLGINPEYCVLSCMDSITRIVDINHGIFLAEFSGKHESSKYHSSVKFSEDNK
jgi:hypothetical protein